jgi:mxaK protein
MQAKASFEQSLRLNPDNRRAKFNLSLLNSVIPINMKNAPKDQSGVELSNTPIGLP